MPSDDAFSKVWRITSAPVGVRAANAIVSYTSYLIKMFYPRRLAALYPHPSDTLAIWQVIASLIILAAISAAVIYTARRRGYAATGWLWYIGTLVPVIGFVQVGAQAMADRYTYIPLTGIFIIIAFGASEIVAKRRYGGMFSAVTAGIVLAALLICTRMQVRFWKDSLTLFRHTLAVTENNFIMHNNYGGELLKAGQAQQAEKHFDAAIRINPMFSQAYKNKGGALLEQGKYDEAIAIFGDLLRVKADWADIHYYMGVAYTRKGQLDDAIRHLEIAVQQSPDWADIHYYMGVAYTRKGRFDDALQHFEIAVQQSPDWPEAYHDLASVYLLLGKFDLAIQNYKEALRLKPNYPSAAENLKIAMEAQSEINKSPEK
jgi:tetratricopeptide (TPR) repeat protein